MKWRTKLVYAALILYFFGSGVGTAVTEILPSYEGAAMLYFLLCLFIGLIWVYDAMTARMLADMNKLVDVVSAAMKSGKRVRDGENK